MTPRRPVDVRYYDGIAGTYDERHHFYDLERRLEEVFSAAGPVSGRLLLDVGTGTGFFAARAVEGGARVVALDIAPRMLEIARRRSGAQVVCGDARRLPLRSSTFSVVISSEMVEHAGDPRAALREIVRVAARGGRVVVTTPNRLWRWSVSLAAALGLRRFEGPEDWLSRRALAETLRAAGVRIEGHAGIHLLPFQLPLRPVLRLLDRARCLAPLCVNQIAWGTKE